MTLKLDNSDFEYDGNYTNFTSKLLSSEATDLKDCVFLLQVLTMLPNDLHMSCAMLKKNAVGYLLLLFFFNVFKQVVLIQLKVCKNLSQPQNL